MYKKWIVIGLVVGLILLLMIQLLKPKQQEVHEQLPLDQQKVSEIRSERTTENVLQYSSSNSKQLILDSETHSDLLQQREQVYQQFQQINTLMSQGQQPNQNQVLALLEQQYNLVKKGVVKLDEAISSIQYLRQILPEMDRALDRQLAKLEQLKK
ncbi:MULTISPECIES: hypothetical protein [unclassified Acinetobacter]|uniref:hypothetical protein n=1 Tax=unclassified Acinetobacter TaxID=196816 RepID=UPI0015D2D9B0|nr:MULTISPECIES: hypothetical protein [unclassified Acinetobacter]UUS64350.1 hypothetical protein MST18_10850 [Acinetobacter sp. YH12068_T]